MLTSIRCKRLTELQYSLTITGVNILDPSPSYSTDVSPLNSELKQLQHQTENVKLLPWGWLQEMSTKPYELLTCLPTLHCSFGKVLQSCHCCVSSYFKQPCVEFKKGRHLLSRKQTMCWQLTLTDLSVVSKRTLSHNGWPFEQGNFYSVYLCTVTEVVCSQYSQFTAAF